MSVTRGIAILGLFIVLATGCSRPEKPVAPGPAAAGTPAASGKWPKFESELSYSYTISGAKFGGTHRSFRYDGGKQFTMVDDKWKATRSVGDITLTNEVTFVEHRDGKDIYKTTYTVTAAGATETRTTEAAYDGTRTILVEDKYGSMVLQPPSK